MVKIYLQNDLKSVQNWLASAFNEAANLAEVKVVLFMKYTKNILQKDYESGVISDSAASATLNSYTSENHQHSSERERILTLFLLLHSHKISSILYAALRLKMQFPSS